MAIPVLSYNLKSIVARWQMTLLAVIGVGVVVAVFVALHAVAAGFERALRSTGKPDNAIVVQKGSQSEPASSFPREQAASLAGSTAVARSGDRALASPEIALVVTLPGASGEPVNVTLRGVTPLAREVRSGITLVAGREPAPGLAELMVGERIQRKVSGLDPGKSVHLQGRDWTVVGVFAAEGGAFESEVWGPLDVVGPAFHREGNVNSLVIRLAGAGALEALGRDIAADPRMRLEARREDDFYLSQSGAVTGPLLALAGFVVVVMGIGAIFAAMNTMNAVVSSRVREVGTLRALGFGRLSILAGFLFESVVLGAVGGGVGCLIALPINGLTGGTGNTAGFAEMAWAFQVTPASLLFGMTAAVLMGTFGGLVPALHAARLPLTNALRGA